MYLSMLSILGIFFLYGTCFKCYLILLHEYYVTGTIYLNIDLKQWMDNSNSLIFGRVPTLQLNFNTHQPFEIFEESWQMSHSLWCHLLVLLFLSEHVHGTMYTVIWYPDAAEMLGWIGLGIEREASVCLLWHACRRFTTTHFEQSYHSAQKFPAK